MNLNYFAILDAGDKEKVQSAMLRFLLYYDPYFIKGFFPAFGGSAEGLTITLEESHKRKRLDLVARSQDGQALVVEKTSSSPSLPLSNCKPMTPSSKNGNQSRSNTCSALTPPALPPAVMGASRPRQRPNPGM